MPHLTAASGSLRQRLLWPVLAACLVVSWSSRFVCIRYASVMQVLFWRSLLSGGLLLPFALMIGPKPSLGAVVTQMMLGVMIVFLYLGGLYPAAKVSAVIYLSPPVTMIWGWALFSERLAPVIFAGLAITLVGVWMTSSTQDS